MKTISVTFVLSALLIIGGLGRVESAEKDTTASTKVDVYKVEDVYAKKDKLSGKKVAVKGKVVKFNAGIMGKNWVHVQDGSGKQGTNDITATTSQSASVGETVLITGILAVNKDFGGGYKYEVIIEEATVTK